MKIKKLLRKFTVNSIDDNCYYNAEDMINFAKYVLKEKLTLTDVGYCVCEKPQANKRGLGALPNTFCEKCYKEL